ncbi:NAD(P)H-binding protein [Lacticaseibacillus parakribbianus]|uniref:NAD(P)H-binding protein n=1 Tax=Lacticaseibacillus parakribbianus TaxID=2970927 RepID=UPI0021CB338C|nr:NAD(P)H-binding protein [Lacticaseibacillus parakribbianus]
MKILVIGATGRVGQALCEQLIGRGDDVVAAARHPERLAVGGASAGAGAASSPAQAAPAEGLAAAEGSAAADRGTLTPLALDLHAPVATLAQAMAGVDAVIFTAGSRGADLIGTDLDGAIQTMQAAERAGVARYVMLSTIFSLDRTRWAAPGIQSLRDYYIAKHYADLFLTRSGLAYTILQAGGLTDGAATGRVAFADEAGVNAVADVAAVLAALVHANIASGRVIPMHAGTTPIAAAIANL